jgi:hypothetical protein
MTLEELRVQRNLLLSASDYLMLPDINMGFSEREDLIAYRLILRDLPVTISDENLTKGILPTPNTDKIKTLLGIN